MTRPASAPRKRTGGTVKQAAPVVDPEPTEPEGDETEGVTDAGRLWATFDFQDRGVRLLQPTDGQQFILLQTVGITDESADDQEKLELALGFATMLRSLFLDPDQRQFVTGALARGNAEIEDYFALARSMAEYWNIDAEPPAANRVERRARERRPVAKAAVRPRR
jgi:hypothetical protein